MNNIGSNYEKASVNDLNKNIQVAITMKNNLTHKLITEFQVWLRSPQNKILSMAFFTMLGLLFIFSGQKDEADPAATNANQVQNLASLDKLIPDGFVLLPIEITNKTALSALVGEYGVVDLMTVRTPINPHTKKVAQGVKILRSPQDPEQFSILLKAELVQKFLKYDGPYFALVANPNKNLATELATDSSTTTNSRIESLH
jgi:hypothetical protein